MKVKLLKDVMEDGNLKVAYRKAGAIPYVKGTVIEMSETSAHKYVSAGLGELVENTSEEPKDEPDTERDSKAKPDEIGSRRRK